LGARGESGPGRRQRSAPRSAREGTGSGEREPSGHSSEGNQCLGTESICELASHSVEHASGSCPSDASLAEPDLGLLDSHSCDPQPLHRSSEHTRASPAPSTPVALARKTAPTRSFPPARGIQGGTLAASAAKSRCAVSRVVTVEGHSAFHGSTARAGASASGAPRWWPIPPIHSPTFLEASQPMPPPRCYVHISSTATVLKEASRDRRSRTVLGRLRSGAAGHWSRGVGPSAVRRSDQPIGAEGCRAESCFRGHSQPIAQVTVTLTNVWTGTGRGHRAAVGPAGTDVPGCPQMDGFPTPASSGYG